MTSKERMLCALKGGKPDRLPVTVHQWMGYHRTKYLGGMSQIEAFRHFGMDAAVTENIVYNIPTSDWRDEIVSSVTVNGTTTDKHIITTPRGTLSYVFAHDKYTGWYAEPIIKEPEDIYLYRDFYPRVGLNKELAQKYYDEIGDDGILRVCVPSFQGGCFQAAEEIAGTEAMIYACYDDPDWVHEFNEILLNQRLDFIYNELKGAKVDLVENGGGGSSDTVISPKMHREFCLPYDKRVHDAIHDVGLPVVYHTCGGMKFLVDIIPENGCDASETLSPQSIGGNVNREDRVYVKQTLGSKVSLIGGMDQFNILTEGSREQIFDEVQNLFETFGAGGGYIMSASDHFFEVPVENMQAFSDAAHTCIY